MVSSECRRVIAGILAKNGIREAEFEANEILREVMGREKPLFSGDEIPGDRYAKMLVMTEKRSRHIPLQYIFGEWEFYGLPFKVGEGVLIPRPDTELLVEAAAGFLGKGKSLLDLCSGSGCIPIALSKTTGCESAGIELSEKAFKYFTQNVALNGAEALVTPIRGDIFELPVTGKFDVITSNPPYLTAEEMTELQPEVRFEPETALFGGADGLDFYRRIFKLYRPLLRENGVFAVETGDGQAPEVKRLMAAAGFSAEILLDLNGMERAVLGKLQQVR